MRATAKALSTLADISLSTTMSPSSTDASPTTSTAGKAERLAGSGAVGDGAGTFTATGSSAAEGFLCPGFAPLAA